MTYEVCFYHVALKLGQDADDGLKQILQAREPGLQDDLRVRVHGQESVGQTLKIVQNKLYNLFKTNSLDLQQT